jgi:hypothetical protein
MRNFPIRSIPVGAARRARVLLAAAAAVLALIAAAPAAEARPRPQQMERFSSNKTFGIGLMLGAPTGLSGKYFLGPDTALDFGIGAIGVYRHRDGLHLHGDFLWHPVNLVKTDPFWLPLYFGIGGRIFFFDDYYYDNDRNEIHDGGVAFGVRAPLGIDMDFNDIPLDVFFELALVVDFFAGYEDTIGVDLNGAIGVRYWFE